MFKSIIAAIDGSEQSLLGLRHAGELAACFGGRVILVHAYPHTSDLRDMVEYNTLVARRKLTGQRVLEAARKHLGAVAVEVEEDLLEGPPAEAILSVAEARRADLIVMGTRGMGSLKGMVFGSVSTQVAHYAHCPVMVVREKRV